MDATNVLAAMASVAASLVGFSGLLTAFRSARSSLSAYDINNIRSLLIVSVSALVFALLPLPFMAMLRNDWVWGALTFLLGANLLFWSVQSPRWMKRKGLRPKRPSLYIAMIGFQAIIGALLMVGAVLVEDAAVLYAAGVLWFLIAAIVVFVVQIFLILPIDRPEPTE